MQLKTNLHLHSQEDPADGSFIGYNAIEAIDRAAQLGFEVLAFTLHNSFFYSDELAGYALSKNILLIPGIEKTIEGRHVLILNADVRAEGIQTLTALAAYRQAKKDILVIAPHPYYYGNISVKEKLDASPQLFDALEQSWFYREPFNRNIRAQDAAVRLNKPLIATSDLHVLSRMDNSYAVIEAAEKTVAGVFAAIKSGAFTNHSIPASWRSMIAQVWLTLAHPGELSIFKSSR
jgi:predicted metal-dependent phosphoesterase TrpH